LKAAKVAAVAVAAVERFQYLYPHLRLRLRPHLKQIHGQLAK
jgi:hypothetical protein